MQVLKSNKMTQKIIPTLVGLVFFASSLFFRLASAQEGGQARISPVITETFPTMTMYLEVKDQEGNFISDLSAQLVTVIEDGNRISPSQFEMTRSGTQFVLVVSPGPAFAIRDSQGLSRFEYLAETFANWAGSKEGEGIDDLSFLASGGPEATHLQAYDDLLSVLGSYQPEARDSIPEIDILASAIDVAADTTPQPGMGRAVLFVTGIPDMDVAPGLQNLAARANQRGVRVNVWMVASSDQFSFPGAGLLADLATSTGGSLFAYSGQESIPNPEEYLEQLRNTYRLEYESLIRSSGLHQVSVEIRQGEIKTTTPVQEFEFQVIPPSIAFVSPPLEITRTAPVESLQDPTAYTPKNLPLEILIEFPDAHPRSLKETSLSVDGVTVQTNNSPPYEKFVWDITPYTTTGEHILVAEAVDSLDLSGRSMETKILVSMDIPRQSVLALVFQNSSILAILASLIAGAVLFLVLVIGGRVRPGVLKDFRRKRSRSDPVTQPVPVKVEPSNQQKTTWMNRLPWPQKTTTPGAIAFLVPIGEAGEEKSTPPISISRDEETFGRDSELVTLVLDDGSIEGIHARLVRDDSGEFRISDEGTIAGTWVNYAPISKEGVKLMHGDLVHFGRLGFRFVERKPQKVRKPVAKPVEPV
jgi:hypothetical protein